MQAHQVTAGISTLMQEEPVKPVVPLAACIDKWAAGEVLGDYHSAALGRKTTATKHTRFSSFPPYLMLQLKRYGAASCASHFWNCTSQITFSWHLVPQSCSLYCRLRIIKAVILCRDVHATLKYNISPRFPVTFCASRKTAACSGTMWRLIGRRRSWMCW